MPPELAALLLTSLSCNIKIIEAIDLSMEWRRSSKTTYPKIYSNRWYQGALGFVYSQKESSSPDFAIGSFWWPPLFPDRFYKVEFID
jgi:hypothetical protein